MRIIKYETTMNSRPLGYTGIERIDISFRDITNTDLGKIEEILDKQLNVDFCLSDESTKYGMLDGYKSPYIKRVIFNKPATIVFWWDGTKTVVKAQDGEPFDKEKGLALCYAKKALGNKGKYYNEIKKHLQE